MPLLLIDKESKFNYSILSYIENESDIRDIVNRNLQHLFRKIEVLDLNKSYKVKSNDQDMFFGYNYEMKETLGSIKKVRSIDEYGNIRFEDSDEIFFNGKYFELPTYLLSGTDKLIKTINSIDFEKCYRKLTLRIGSRVKMINDEDKYEYGFNDSMKPILGSIQTLKDFQSPFLYFVGGSKHLRANYHVSNIQEVIEF